MYEKPRNWCSNIRWKTLYPNKNGNATVFQPVVDAVELDVTVEILHRTGNITIRSTNPKVLEQLHKDLFHEVIRSTCRATEN